jgi:hypothetical protein
MLVCGRDHRPLDFAAGGSRPRLAGSVDEISPEVPQRPKGRQAVLQLREAPIEAARLINWKAPLALKSVAMATITPAWGNAAAKQTSVDWAADIDEEEEALGGELQVCARVRGVAMSVAKRAALTVLRPLVCFSNV